MFLKVVALTIFWQVSLSALLDIPGNVLVSPVGSSDEREVTIYLFQFKCNLFVLREEYQLCNCLHTVATFLFEKTRDDFGHV